MDGKALAMNLQELHTPHPLRDADFAAIRARVKAEIARKPSWMAMFARFAFAASLIVVFVPIAKERKPNVPVQVTRSGPPASPPAERAASPPPTRVAARDAATSAGETPALRETPAVPQHAQAERIEIITSDPTIRIIWITPKESS